MSHTSITQLRVAVVGGGDFGQGIAVAAARKGAEVRLWTRSAQKHAAKGVRITSELSDVQEAELVFLATPSHVVQEVGMRLGHFLDGRHFVVHVSRGLVGDELETLSRVLRRVTPCRRIGALAGPLDSGALHNATPTGAILGTEFPDVEQAVRDALSGPELRLYHTRDIIGVEVSSALVGLFALAAGYALKAGVGPGALATFLTRALSEAGRVVTALGGDVQTLHGMAGVGDLLAVMAGDERPETRLGAALAKGVPLDKAVVDVRAHIEGVSIADRIVRFGDAHDIDVPICQGIHSVLTGKPLNEVLAGLMARSGTRE